MTDIILGGPPIPLYENDNILDTSNIYDKINQILILFENEPSNEKINEIHEILMKAMGYNINFSQNNADIIKNAQIALTDINTLYISLTILISLIIIIWILCFIGLYNWIIALILTIIIIALIFVLSFAYKSKCNYIIDDEFSKLKIENDKIIENFKNNIHQLPKSLHDLLLIMIDDNKKSNNQKSNNQKSNNQKSNNQKLEIKRDCGCKK